MKNKLYLLLEFFILFVLIPVSLTTSFSIGFNVAIVVVGFIYLLFVMLRKEKISFNIKKNINWSPFWRKTLIAFFIISIITTLYVYFVDVNALFCMPLQKPLFWIGILMFYTFLSVWPQELIYRTFFFSRYERLFLNKKLLIFINAIVFSLAHLFFRNTLVIVFTFVGGILFAYTYYKTRSTLLVSIEHALYGCWLVTVGMGEMLAFPGMESC